MIVGAVITQHSIYHFIWNSLFLLWTQKNEFQSRASQFPAGLNYTSLILISGRKKKMFLPLQTDRISRKHQQTQPFISIAAGKHEQTQASASTQKWVHLQSTDARREQQRLQKNNGAVWADPTITLSQFWSRRHPTLTSLSSCEMVFRRSFSDWVLVRMLRVCRSSFCSSRTLCS